MSKFRKSLSVLLVIALFSCSALAGQDDWANVKNLKRGSRIVVETKAGRTIRGELRLATDDKLFVEAILPDGSVQDVAFEKNDVLVVRKRGTRGPGGVNSLLGAAIGLGAGLAIGAGVDAAHKGGDDPGVGKLIFGMLGTTTGLAVGGSIPTKDKTIYVAP